MNRARNPIGALAVVAAVCSSACYTFAPTRVEDARPDQRVRVLLGPVEAARLADFADADSRTLEGRLLEATSDSILVLVPSHTELRGARVETLFQRVQVSRAGAIQVQLKHLDRQRTYLVTGLAAVAVGAFAVDRLRGRGGSDVVRPGGGPNDALIPSVRVPFSLWALVGR